MDPLTVSAVAAALDKLLGAAAGEAGKSAWAGLVKLVRSAFPGHAATAEAVRELAAGDAPDQAAVIDVSAELVTLARGDSAFESGLRQWLEHAGTLHVDGAATTNVISAGSTVHGNVVQARDVGSVTFGS